MSFNYVDSYNGSKQMEFYSKQHDNAVELQGRRTYIFKLDKEITELSDIYNEAKHARVYLPHYEQRALYNTNEWRNSINLNNYIEDEDIMSFEYNFARMVYNIRDLKDKISGKFTSTNIGEENLKATLDKRFKLETYNSVVLVDVDLKEYKSIKMFIEDVQSKCSLINMEYEGDAEKPENINSFNMRLNPRKKFSVDVKDRLYENCTDVVESGDIILTDTYKAYQVQSVYPTNVMINNYISWTAKANVVDLAVANLPDDYRKIVERNRYGMPKINKE